MPLSTARILAVTHVAASNAVLLGGAAAFVLLAGLAGGCGSSDQNPAGAAGSSVGASGSGGASAASTSSTSSSTTSSSTTSSTTSGGSGGAPGDDAGGGGGSGPGAASNLAKTCTADTDCTGGLVCKKVTDNDFFGGGPAGGYCTFKCAADTDETKCQGFGGTCVHNDYGVDGDTWCLRTCTFGSRTRATKCRARNDVACSVVNDQTSTAACLAMCSQDADCPMGRKCDPFSTVCVDMPKTGDPVGSNCTLTPQNTSSCAGDCIGIGTGMTTYARVCSNRCVIGNSASCNVTNGSLSTGGPHGVCAFSTATAAIGDIGHCAQQCDSASECRNQMGMGLVCFTADNIKTVTGHGYCYWDPAAGGTDAGRRD